MGCDIHMYVEYKRKKEQESHYYNYGGRINPGRNYYLFGLLSKGVRTNLDNGIPPKGLPENISYSATHDYWIHVNDKYSEEGHEGYCTSEQAEKWQTYGSVYDKNSKRVSNPDWHSHSWLTAEELEQQIEVYKKETEYGVGVEYMALLASMKEIENHDYECRVVFWFDN